MVEWWNAGISTTDEDRWTRMGTTNRSSAPEVNAKLEDPKNARRKSPDDIVLVAVLAIEALKTADEDGVPPFHHFIIPSFHSSILPSFYHPP
jgi:hypothetical protein